MKIGWKIRKLWHFEVWNSQIFKKHFLFDFFFFFFWRDVSENLLENKETEETMRRRLQWVSVRRLRLRDQFETGKSLQKSNMLNLTRVPGH